MRQESAPSAQGETSETDNVLAFIHGGASKDRLEFLCRKLERQRDALRAENERLRELVRSYQLGALPSGGES